MKPTRFVRPFVCLLALSACLAAAAPRAAVQDRYEEFRTKLVELMKLDDKEGLAKLVKSYQEEAERHVAEICWRTRPIPSESKKQIAALDVAWQTTFSKSNFVNRMYGYYSQLGERSWKDWAPAKAKHDEALKAFDENLKGARDAAVWDDIGARSESIAKDFEGVGDHYYAAQAWTTAAICFDENYRDKAAGSIDYARAAKAYEEARRNYLYVEFNAARFDQIKTRGAELASKSAPPEQKPKPGGEAGKGGGEPPKGGEAGGGEQGGGGDAGEPGQPGEPGADGAPAGAVTVPLTFEMVEKLEAYQRPHYHTDDVYQIWRPIQFRGNGDVQSLDLISPSPKFKRVTAAQFEVDQDGDGKFDKQVSITGNRQPLTLTIGTDDKQREWGFLFTIGLEKDIYQGLQVHLGPADKSLGVYTAGAASMVGKLGEVQLRVIDDDLNAVYGNWPQTWGHIGLTANAYQPEMDCLVVGTEKRARPWSEYQHLQGKWYQFANEKFGTLLHVAPAEVETGTLKLDFKGPVWPTWLILRGAGRYENTFIDVAADGKRGVALPAGEWSIYYGELRKGAKQQTMKCLILPPVEPKSWTVAAGKELVLKLGEPFRFDFAFENLGDSVKVLGQSVAVLGKEGERYERLWNCVPQPECEWRKAGTKKGGKPEKMGHMLDPLDPNVWVAVWKPLDTLLPMKEQVDKVEVHLFEKKHKFLGAIDSPWKGE